MHKAFERLIDTLFLAAAGAVLVASWPDREPPSREEQLKAWLKNRNPSQDHWKVFFWRLGGPRALFALAYEQADRAIRQYRIATGDPWAARRPEWRIRNGR